ncbi:MAG: GspH/FimT family protein [Gammaproteobacteria bacterium]|nr:GspH/FimT family protein [Gammaproteobacteria bacterium]
MQGSLLYAKGLAITGGQSVSLCRRDGLNGGTVCNNGMNWEDGWIVFRDVNGNGVIDAPVDTNGDGVFDCLGTDITSDCLLKMSDPLSPLLTLRSNGTIGNTITFNSRSFALNTGVFRLCDDRGVRRAIGLEVVPPGNLKRMADTNADGIVNDENGVNVACP